jgi:diguanylate cyclase
MTLRYEESYEASAECLRLALRRMAEHKMAVNPLNYALWYEYLSGRNEPLSRAFSEVLVPGQPLAEEQALELFNRYIIAGDVARLEKIQISLRGLLEALLSTTVEMDSQAENYGKSLDAIAPQLRDGMGIDALRDIVSLLVASTEEMRNANRDLRVELANNAATVESLRRELESARQQAKTDPLTGLANRTGFADAFLRCTDTCGECAGGGISLLLLDIDYFKRVNDRFGHLFGDKVIQGVANVLRASIKGQDTAARYGGEEFAVLLPGTPLGSACKVGEFIRQRLARSRIRRGSGDKASEESVTASFGAAQWRCGEALECLIERADRALYAAKQAGRNRLLSEASLPTDQA